MDVRKPLQRSRTERKVAGVCGGIAEWLGWDVTLVRVLYILATIFSGVFPGLVVYAVLWAVMPEAGEEAGGPRPPGTEPEAPGS